MKNVFVVGGSHGYHDPFVEFGPPSSDMEFFIGSPEEIRNKISFVLFTGGEDISPILYGEKQNRKTYSSMNRDLYEVTIYNMALRYDLPMVGVCRGSQFLCVMAGGKLVQHCENHSGNHEIDLWDGRKMFVSSTHHQMQLPPQDANIVGWTKCRSKTYQNGNGKEIPMTVDVEIVHYPTINAVGMQYHPEMMDESSDGFKLAAELVRNFLFMKQSSQTVA